MSTPFINGKRHSWASIKLNMLGRDVTGFTAISYGDSVEKENLYGAGQMPIARGEGNYEAKASITLYNWEVNAILAALGPGRRLTDIDPFDITVVFMPKGQAGLVTHVIRNCEFVNNDIDVSQGDTSIPVELELLPSHIEWI
jgi:hypothetical protein